MIVPTNTIFIIFPPKTVVYESVLTDVPDEDIFNLDGLCKDEVYDFDWSELLEDEYEAIQIIDDLKSKLNNAEKAELDLLLKKDYSEIEQKINAADSWGHFGLEEERKLKIVKLLAYYRWSLFGKSNLASSYGYTDNNFYSQTNMEIDCSILLDIDTLVAMKYPKCKITKLGDSSLKIDIIADDLALVSRETKLKFNDVLYYRSSGYTLPLRKIVVSVDLPNIYVNMIPEVDIAEKITV